MTKNNSFANEVTYREKHICACSNRQEGGVATGSMGRAKKRSAALMLSL